MKKLIHLSLALIVANGLTAQTVSKSGNGTVKTTTSGTHYNHQSTGTYTGATGKQTNYGTSDHIIKSHTNTSSQHPFLKESSSKDHNPALSDKNVTEKMTGTNSAEKGGIYKVGEGEILLLNYEDRDKLTNGSSQDTTNGNYSGNNASNTANSFPKGLSETIKSQNPVVDGKRIIHCDNDSLNRTRYAEKLLSQYENIDWNVYKQCHKSLPKNYKHKVDCEEFENSSDERRHYILDNLEFYDITALRNCEAYLNFDFIH